MPPLPLRLGPWPSLLAWFVSKPCPLCREPLPAPGLEARFCPACAETLALPQGGVAGTRPLPWWAAGPYSGAYRRLLLGLRQRPHPDSLAALLQAMALPALPPHLSPLMVPVPSWKRQANPLPALICRLGRREWGFGSAPLLERSRPVLGQHHLQRAMRQENQRGAFTCVRRPHPQEARQQPVFLVDDILTTGATALNASMALQGAGWRVQGVICLARTPADRRARNGDLRSPCRESDKPG
ncbi:MAG: ComF family protein [Cyanobacteriota bacterium]|jgi:predicted amidophosphoribosyltransferase|nr:ComF family protein [Cyanobacteriota bacterium]